MPRGQSPYQGRYTVPTVDFSPITQGGAAWGRAFESFGRDVGGAIKERKDLKSQLKKYETTSEAMEEWLPYLLDDNEAGQKLKTDFSNFRKSISKSSDLNLRQKVAAGEGFMPTASMMLGLAMKKMEMEKRHPPTGADKFRDSLIPTSDAQTPTPPPPDLAALEGDTPDVPSQMPDLPALTAPTPTTPTTPTPPLSEIFQEPPAAPPTTAPTPTAAPPTAAQPTAAPTAPVPGLEPPAPLTQEQQRLLEWGRGAGLKDVDSTIRPQLNAARAKEKELREWPIQQQDFQKAALALREQNFDLNRKLQPGMTKDALKQEVSSLREKFPGLNLNFNVSEKKGEEGKAGYKLTFNATVKGPTFTMVTSETADGDTVKLPLWTNGTDYFVVDQDATDPKDILKNIGDDPLEGLSAYSADLGRSIKELRAETAGVDEAGKQFTVGEFEDLAQILAANPNLMKARRNDEGNVVWELDVEGWDDDIEWVGKAKDRAIALKNDLRGRLKQLNEISAAYEEKSPLTRTPQPTPTARPPITPARAQAAIDAGRIIPR